MSLLPEDVEKAHRAAMELRILNAELRHAFLDEPGKTARLRDAAEVSLHIGHEAGNARLTKSLGQHLQRNRFTGTGGAGDESVTAGHPARDGNGAAGAMGYVKPSLFVQHR